MNPDNEFESAEKEFRKFKPAEPSDRLRRRLESTVSYPPFAVAPGPEKSPNIVRPPKGIWASPWLRTAAAALIGAAAVLAFFKVGSDTPDIAKVPGAGESPKPISPSFPRSVNPEGFRLAGQENRIFDSQDDGIVFSKDEIPFRRVRYNTVDRRVFRDPETGAIFELLVPREDVLIVPAETF